jgi:predicted unusual protein kinase regulating ubiquinone biosynthesis (AarF/ABC1/UbiB family)
MSGQKELKKIKTSTFSRSLSIAKLTLNTSTSLAAHGIGRLFGSEDDKANKWKGFLESRAKDFTQELGQLKGSLMKAGQMLSMYGEQFLPPEANQFLKTLQSDSPPVDWPFIEAVLKTELGDKIKDLEIETKASGSASLGQVHKAKIKSSGEEVAMKIQYPGVEQALESDIRGLRAFLSLVKIIPRGTATDHMFEEIRDMLRQELDYNQELIETQKFYERVRGDSRYIVPKVYPQYSTKKVIVTSFEKGFRPDDPVVQNLKPERKNRLAKNFLELYFRELFHWGVVQTDPHLGNYRIRISPKGEDQLILFDFGAVRYYPDSFLKPYHRMVKSALENNPQDLRKYASELKFLREGDNPDIIENFEKFCLLTVEPFIAPTDPRNREGRVSPEGIYSWKSSDLPQRLTQIVFNLIRNHPLRTPPKEIIFLDRKTAGVFIFLRALGAEMNGREVILPFINELN